MTDHHQDRGGAPVAVLNRLCPAEALAIINLRMWFDGGIGQHAVWNGFANAFPAGQAVHEMKAFERLLSIILIHGRRPLARHDTGCVCVGADEAIFANLIGTAASGATEDAALIATLLVGAAHAQTVADMAARVGSAIDAMAKLQEPAAPAPRETPIHFH